MIKFIDKIKYWHLLIMFALGIGVCWALFNILTPYGHGISPSAKNVPAVGLFESFYFSVVTISSLGYGDYRPVGYGRVIAIIEVVYGLIILALLVSKIASERTSTLIRLLYTSDTEKRVREFADGNELKNSELRNAIESHDFEKISYQTQSLKIAFTAYLHFFVYQSREGHIDGRWAEKAFLRLLKSVKTSTILAIQVAKVSNITHKERSRYVQVMRRARSFSDALSSYYDEPNINGSSNHIKKLILDYDSYIKKMSLGIAHPITLTGMSDDLLNKIKADLPDPEHWIRDTHKMIAKKYRISNNLASKAIKKILEIE